MNLYQMGFHFRPMCERWNSSKGIVGRYLV